MSHLKLMDVELGLLRNGVHDEGGTCNYVFHCGFVQIKLLPEFHNTCEKRGFTVRNTEAKRCVPPGAWGEAVADEDVDAAAAKGAAVALEERQKDPLSASRKLGPCCTRAKVTLCVG